jgi:hypothetical protein
MKLLSWFVTAPRAVALAVSALLLVVLGSANGTFANGAPHKVDLPLVSNNHSIPTATPTPTATPSGDPHFGVIVSSDLPTTMSETGLTWWYQFGAATPSGEWSSVAQISLSRGRVPATTLQQAALAHPGSYWIIGNEPNVPGQDNVSGSTFATELKYYIDTIKSADPTAKLVGPNILNWDNTCTSCEGGFPSGHSWVDQFRAAWMSQYGGEPPLDVWGIHTYSIDWNELFANHSLTNPAGLESDISGMSSYLGGIPALAAKPIWITEFGILWAFNGYSIVSGGCPVGTCYAPPAGTPTSVSYDTVGVASFINSFSTWMKTTGQTLRVQKWFLYTSFGQPEPYMTTYAGISVVENINAGAPLSTSGQIYRQQSLTPVP